MFGCRIEAPLNLIDFLYSKESVRYFNFSAFDLGVEQRLMLINFGNLPGSCSNILLFLLTRLKVSLAH